MLGGTEVDAQLLGPLAFLLVYVVLSVLVTRYAWRKRTYTRRQRFLMLIAVWLFPIVGAGLVWLIARPVDGNGPEFRQEWIYGDHSDSDAHR